MFEVRIVVALAFVCLQVWCAGADPLVNYFLLFDCIMEKRGPFKDFFPFRIGNFPFACSNFSGKYEHVDVDDPRDYTMDALPMSDFSNGTVVIKFRHTFYHSVLHGFLKESTDSRNFDNEVKGYIENLTLEGEVSYGNRRVTMLDMTVTFESVSLEGQNAVLLPFTNGETERYYRNYLANNKEAIENGTIALINEKIDTPAKFASIKAGCRLV